MKRRAEYVRHKKGSDSFKDLTWNIILRDECSSSSSSLSSSSSSSSLI
jgi:hypothetical protein